MTEEVKRNSNKLHEDAELKNVFIRRYLNKEDRKLLRGKVEEAKEIASDSAISVAPPT